MSCKIGVLFSHKWNYKYTKNIYKRHSLYNIWLVERKRRENVSVKNRKIKFDMIHKMKQLSPNAFQQHHNHNT